eukprot:TRINITY_DN27798_c0_g1_i1.p2 TRINITY_DN27798_c0_g1~~TRINITY_DN27798_c0_g1_i1.p2  ORF type:complete len:121 (+),score=52.13 TRINITY_DN27798_c0_g1_i1:65-427(+)
MQQPMLPPGTSMREAEMLQTAQFFQQLHAVQYSKHRALETCFEKCMDVDDLQTAYRRDLDERKRTTAYKKEKTCMLLCHKKYQKAFSMAVDGFKGTPLQMKLMESLGQGNLGGELKLTKQ